jgi:hypothetical protein
MALLRKISPLLPLVIAVAIPAAASTSHKPPTQEVYSAVEDDSAASAPAQTVPITAPLPAPVTRKAVVQARAAAPAARRSSVASKLPDAALAYDLVPSDQIDPLARRLQLVEALIRRHARAYDYRIHTVPELETILAKLDAAEGPAAPAHAAAEPKRIAKAAPAALPTPNEDDEVNGGTVPSDEE